MSKVHPWKCRACGSIVVGINWSRTIKGKQFHATPTGGECRAVNFDQLTELGPDDVTVPSRDQDDTAEHVPLSPNKPS